MPKAMQAVRAGSPSRSMSNARPKWSWCRLVDAMASRSSKTSSNLVGSTCCIRYCGFRDGRKNGSVACSHLSGNPIAATNRSTFAVASSRKERASPAVPTQTISRMEKLHWRSSATYSSSRRKQVLRVVRYCGPSKRRPARWS